MTKEERATFLLKYARVHARCFRVGKKKDKNGNGKFHLYRLGYYWSEEWK